MGFDWYYGWGRLQFSAISEAAEATLPNVFRMRLTNSQVVVSAEFRTGLAYSLWRTSVLVPPAWQPVTNAVALTNGNVITLTDPCLTGSYSFYRVQAAFP